MPKKALPKKEHVKKKKALIIEDERSLAEVIQMKMSKKDFMTVPAVSVAEAIDALHKHDDIAVIWLDHYLLGEGDGLAFARHLQSHDSARNIPLFIVTNSVSPEKEIEYRNAGAVNYYVKADHRLDDIIQGIKAYIEKDE